MNHINSTTENDIINFAMIRLNNFKRINFGWLTEVINDKFSVAGINALLWNQLIKIKKAELKKGYLIILN
jgi:hypothetical protein